MSSRWARTSILCLLALRILACCYGWDRLPLLTTYDEAIINDPAVALSRGFGLVAFSYSGNPIAERFAHFPPLFVFLQAATFRVFGFSALTLRFWPLAFEVIGNVLLLWLLERLWKRGIVAGWAAALTACLCLLDLPTLWNSRGGRMDTMVVLLGLLAAALLLGEKTKPFRWWIAALLIGLAMSTHPVAILYYWAFAVALWVFRRELGWRVAVACCLLPGVTLIAIWIGTHGSQSLSAFRQFQTIHAQHQDLTMEFGWWARVVRDLDVKDALNWGLTWGVVVIGWIAPALAWLVSRRKIYGILAIAGAGLYLVAYLFTGLFVPRVVVAFPLALLLLAVSLSCLRGAGIRIASVLLTLLLVVEAAALVAYLSRARGSDADRSPDRFETLKFPASVTIASVPQLWFHFIRNGRAFRVIDAGLPLDDEYWMSHQSKLDEYDVVILESDHGYLGFPGMRDRKVTKIHDAGWEYWILEKQGQKTQALAP